MKLFLVSIGIILMILKTVDVLGKNNQNYFNSAPPLGEETLRDYSPQKNSPWTCTTCEAIFKVVMFQIRQLNRSESEIDDHFKSLCPLFRVWGRVRIGVEMPDSPVCTAVIERMVPTIYFIIKNRPQITPQIFCGYTMEQMGCSTNDPYMQWSVKIPAKKKISIKMSGNPGKISRQKKSLQKILHLTDIHLDLSYQFDTEAVCRNSVLCCHNESEAKPNARFWSIFSPSPLSPPEEEKKAGFFGDSRRCDAPLKLLDLTLRHLVKVHPDIDLIYMTGDLVPRNIHSLTKPDNVRAIESASKLIYKYFPTTTVIPALGNHETHPVNLYSPPDVPEEINTMWIYNVTLTAWRPWISLPEQKKTFLTGGYYAVQLKSKNLTILVINTNHCYGLNLWGMYKVKDPRKNLQWLVQELQKAEKSGQFVHIVGHISPGRSLCTKMWSRNFYKIVARYHMIIKGQFYGHTHFDELKLLYGSDGQVISSLFISPALTPYRRDFSRDPGYKIFYANGGSEIEDSATWDILDYATFIFDLDEANQTPTQEPRWFQLYRATEVYGIEDTTFKNLGRMVDAMAMNKTLFDIYFQYTRKSAPKFGRGYTSSVNLQRKMLCDMVQPYSLDWAQCHRIERLMGWRGQ